MGRRANLLAAVLLVALGEVTLAEMLAGSRCDDRLIGSNQRDSISGGGGEDLIKVLRAIDSLNDGDDIYAGPREEKRGIPSSQSAATTW